MSDVKESVGTTVAAEAAVPSVTSITPTEAQPTTSVNPQSTGETTVPPAVDAPPLPPAPPTIAQPPPAPPSIGSSSVTATVPAAPATPSKPTTTKSKKKKTTTSTTPPVVSMTSSQVNSSSASQGAAGENTGRWTAEEHRLFLQGLEQHGKGWKKIASLIKSRTVVQIRTHAQKYFQKLAKARQNGEEGDVAMEGRGGISSVNSVSTATNAPNPKRRRQMAGTKRKAIHSVVSSAVKQGKKMMLAQPGVPNPVPPLPAVAPTLAHFVLPTATDANGENTTSTSSCVPSITTAQGTISGPALEDSLFRFLTPAPVVQAEPHVNEVARQAGANPITLPSENPSSAPTIAGEISPTGVADLALYPSWTDAKDTPSWYAKGADVDALLDVGDALDWLADNGDLHETYQPPSHIASDSTIPEMHAEQVDTTQQVATGGLPTATPAPSQTNSMIMSSLTHVDTVVPPLPSIFDGAPDSCEHLQHHDVTAYASNPHLSESVSAVDMDDHLQVFDTPMEEHDFVSTILEDTHDTTDALPALS